MGDPARETTNDPLTIAGLEEIFVEECDSLVSGYHQTDTSLSEGYHQANDSLSGLSLKDACRYYGLGATALRAKIKLGQIPAEKVDGPKGPEWRIFPDKLVAASRQAADTVAQPFHQGIESRKLLDMLETTQTKLNEAQKELQAATYRNGYLESKLEERADQLKLLPDFQAQAEKARVLEQRLQEEEMHKQALLVQLQQESEAKAAKEQSFLELQAEVEKYKNAWWRRFGCWFIGQKS